MFTISKKNKWWPWSHRDIMIGKSSTTTGRKTKIFLGVVIALIVLRIVGVMIAHKKINEYLATFSPTYSFHINDLDISIIRGAYRFEGIEGTLKRNGHKFANIESVDVSLAWRELIKGRILTDITINEMDFTYLKELTSSAKKSDTDDAKKAKDTLFPVRVEKLDLVNSKIVLDGYKGLDPSKSLTASGIEGRMTNVTATENFPFTFYNLKANLLGTSILRTTGQLNLLSTPTEWDFNGEIIGFNLAEANNLLKTKIPLTFTKGKVDIYAEAISEKGVIKGYVNPFLKDIDVVSSKEKWDLPKQMFIEILTALGNLVLRTDKTKTVATHIPFSYNQEFKVDTNEAIEKVIEHGFKQQLSPGLENRYELKVKEEGKK